jgi:hypothetical protein
MTTLVFMHVGGDVALPTLMARSFRRHNPDARILQVSDMTSSAIEGVDEVVRRQPTDNNIMLFRMRCFASLPAEAPTWFLDTDMLCVRPLAPPPDCGRVAVCQREFGRDNLFNHRFRGMDMSEYAGRTLGSVYPFVGCATYVDGSDFWRVCLAEMEALDPKFHNWYGDQEAIRNVVASGREAVSMLPESLYACLPEHERAGSEPYVFHYKGGRKALMQERAAAEGLA